MINKSGFAYVVMASMLLISLGCKKILSYDIVLNHGQVYDVKQGVFAPANIGITAGKVDIITNSQIQGEISIDCSGSYVYPGFIDAHCHFRGYAIGLNAVNLIGSTSYQDVISRINSYIAKNENKKFIVGRGWDQNDWEEKSLPTNELLNTYFPDRPVYLTRVDGHAALVNDACLALADSLPVQLRGGLVVRKDGTPTGLLIDDAQNLIQVPKTSTEELRMLLQQAEQNCLERGLTLLVDAGLSYAELMELNDIYKSGLLSIPMYAMVSDDEADVESLIASGKVNSERFQVSAIKIYADGALGSRGALLTKNYSDDSANQGLQLISYESLLHLCEKAKANNFQVNVHAIGDSANKMVLQAFAEVLEPDNDRRWHIEHAQVILSSDSTIWGKYNIIPSVQPTHATSDMYWAEERLGPNRVKNAYAYKRLKRWANGRMALGTDFPVEDIDPLKTFFAASIRKDGHFFPENGFQLNDGITREEALYGMTLGAAYSVFKENETGSIEKGKWGDIIILNKNILECDEKEILSTRILNTIVHGEVLYSAPK